MSRPDGRNRPVSGGALAWASDESIEALLATGVTYGDRLSGSANSRDRERLGAGVGDS